MTNALATLTPQEWTTLSQMAEALHRSGMLPQSIKSVEAAKAIILLGRELDIAPWQSLSTINVISGKPTVSPQLMLALIRRAGVMESFECKVSDTAVTCTMKRKGEAAHTETFSMADAKAMELAGRDNWKKQPKTMMKWRAVAACCRVVFPDVILGLYTPEEMGAEVEVMDDGNMTVVAPPQAALPPQHTENAQDAAPDNQWHMIADAWSKFERWARATYGIEGDAVADALAVADGWERDKRVAMAAMIAYYCKYDAACIERETASKHSIETIDAAIAIAERVLAQRAAEPEAAPETEQTEPVGK